MTIQKTQKVLARGRYLTLIDEGGWEYVIRPDVRGVVVIVAVTDDRKLVLVEQHRVAVHQTVVELPAGLVGDLAGQSSESLLDAAGRELEEETGFRARELVALAEGPIAVGVSNEVITFIEARGLTRVGPGGGDDTENITVREVPLPELRRFLAERAAAGLAIDTKIYAGLFLLGLSTGLEGTAGAR